MWSITGFRGKTLWDWMQLLIVPAALGTGAVWFDYEAGKRSDALQRERERVQREIESQRTMDAVLSAYFDDLSTLLLEHGLTEAPKDSPVRNLARARTLTSLSQLDGRRKGYIVHFLYETTLIAGDPPVIYLGGSIAGEPAVDEVVLSRADLNGAALHRVYLGHVNLTRVHMIGADFRWARLSDANFIGADLRGADFTGARLTRAKLSAADLSGTRLHDADLGEATGLSQDQLDRACGNGGTRLPDGLSIASC